MSRLNKHYIVYETTNNINGMTYIGCHGTYDLEDGYIGAGIYSQAKAEIKLRHGHKGAFASAVCKFGYENFSTRIIKNLSTRKEAAALEKSILNEEFIALDSNYNTQVGGFMSDSIPRQEIDEQKMYDLYMGGMTQSQVGLEMGISNTLIVDRLKGWDISGRHDPYKIDVDEAYKLYMSGMTYHKIAEKIGSTIKVVYTRLSGMDKSGRKVVRPFPAKKRAMMWVVENYDHYQSLYSQGKTNKKAINAACPWDLEHAGLLKEFTREKK